jgi:hypothetical protein
MRWIYVMAAVGISVFLAGLGFRFWGSRDTADDLFIVGMVVLVAAGLLERRFR